MNNFLPSPAQKDLSLWKDASSQQVTDSPPSFFIVALLSSLDYLTVLI